MAVLAGDIGGTGTVLAIFESAEQGLEPLGETRFASRRHESLEQIDKGRFSDLVASIPVQVALEPRASLLGAAHFALTL